ncbi:MAG: UDP-N-acetylglucosamine--N-acetylmuramyl-(pentapeptide) pyrophosphoryl-undecaprenol N-acetylglucosamine transferase [Kiritimatiellae bacterium]|nr:UDP-N-acetylglucosamine--N-acetylmuramyl-(pentapeptide) pyrophosphoryl-undecaprenol N-acetylglucosamine transferase [Kiritimatiellia bacterium]
MANRFIVACGGTGGHSFPGLAVAQELRARGHEVVVWASGRAIESSVMKAWDGPAFSTGARPLAARNSFANVFSLFRCWREMGKFAPDVLLAMGSYASFEPVVAAVLRHVPVVLHEANTVPGRAVDWLARHAKTIAVSFAVTAGYLKGRKVELTGLPVRAEIVGQARFGEVPPDAFCVFVTGGSQGAHRVNELAAQALVLVQAGLAKRGPGNRLFVVHQTGAADEEMVRQRYEAAGVPARVQAFEREMGRAFATADIVVARAGASTCFELARVGKPAFFIPLPGAVRDHQHFNAQSFVQAGAADEGIQDSLTPRALANYILHKMDHPEELAKKASAMRSMSAPDAAAKVADLLERTAAHISA